MPAHLVVVHFPIALIVVGALIDALGALAALPDARRWGGVLLILGALAALIAFWTGQGALLDLRIANPAAAERVEAHSQWGGAGVWLLVASGMLRALWRSRLEGAFGWINLAVGFAAALLAVAITLSGTAVRHGG